MGNPVVGEEKLYELPVMWLDGISIDSNVVDPFARRYAENKRSNTVHSKGWESIWAASVDAPVTMIQNGNYMKIPLSEKAMITARIQSWILVDSEQGIVDPPPAAGLPSVQNKNVSKAINIKPAPQLKLRPGQKKIKPSKAPRGPSKARPNPPPKPKKKKAPRPRKAQSSDEGGAPARAHSTTFILSESGSSQDSESAPLQKKRNAREGVSSLSSDSDEPLHKKSNPTK